MKARSKLTYYRSLRFFALHSWLGSGSDVDSLLSEDRGFGGPLRCQPLSLGRWGQFETTGFVEKWFLKRVKGLLDR